MSQPPPPSPGPRIASLRIARATDRLEDCLRFYRDGLGLSLLGAFEDHEGFDGVMLGLPGLGWHLELTHRRGHEVGRAPNGEALLVLYLPERAEWERAVRRLEEQGHRPVPAVNPYWDRLGRSYEDPDGYRVVLQPTSWPPRP